MAHLEASSIIHGYATVAVVVINFGSENEDLRAMLSLTVALLSPTIVVVDRQLLPFKKSKNHLIDSSPLQ